MRPQTATGKCPQRIGRPNLKQNNKTKRSNNAQRATEQNRRQTAVTNRIFLIIPYFLLHSLWQINVLTCGHQHWTGYTFCVNAALLREALDRIWPIRCHLVVNNLYNSQECHKNIEWFLMFFKNNIHYSLHFHHQMFTIFWNFPITSNYN